MFPEHSGAYIAQREEELYIVKVKGVYPTLQLDKNIVNLGAFLKNGKISEASKGVAENITLMHQKWEFYPLNFLDNIVFSNTEFRSNGEELYLSYEDLCAVEGMYYRLVQQGVSSLKIIKALSYEFKVSTDQVINLINGFADASR